MDALQKQPVQSIVTTGCTDNNAAMSAMWSLTPAVIQEINKSAMIRSSKHGMFASVPIICKAHDCAYSDVCTVDPSARIIGQRCPMEIGAIIARFDQWCRHFNIDISGETIQEGDITDATLVRDLVNLEVQMMRCENKIAMSGDFMGETLADIDKKCKPYFETTVTPESEYLLTLQNAKTKVLNQLNATRKDKAQDKARASSPTEAAIKIFQQVQSAINGKNNGGTIIDLDDVDFSEVPDNKNDELSALIEEAEAESEELI